MKTTSQPLCSAEASARDPFGSDAAQQAERARIRRIRIIAAILCFTFLVPQASLAQRSDKGKEIVQDLLRALIESQLQRQGGQSLSPGQPGAPVAGNPSQRQTPDVEMQKLRQLLIAAGQESETLTAQATEDGRRNLAVRNLQPQILQFQGEAAALRQRAERVNNPQVLRLSIQELDQNWKPLAHRISALPGAGRQTKECAERLSQLSTQLCEIYGIREQYNSRELVRAADLLAADLHILADEVSYIAVNRQQLAERIHRLDEQTTLFANMAANGAQFRAVVTDYQSLYGSWTMLRTQLDTMTSRSVNRIVSRIQDTHRTMHDLLRLEFVVDSTLVRKLTADLEQEISELYRSITLEQIMSLPDGRSLPAVADVLDGMAQNLDDVVARNEPAQQIGEAWLYFDQQWQVFSLYLQPVRVPEIRRRLEGIAQTSESLKTNLGLTLRFDRRAIIQQSASLNALTDNLHNAIHRWLGRPGQQAPGLIEKSHTLEELCAELSRLANAQQNPAAMSAKCEQILNAWQQLRPDLAKCETVDRDTIDQIAAQFIPALIQMRTMVEE